MQRGWEETSVCVFGRVLIYKYPLVPRQRAVKFSPGSHQESEGHYSTECPHLEKKRGKIAGERCCG